jgi:hypothetical protein
MELESDVNGLDQEEGLEKEAEEEDGGYASAVRAAKRRKGEGSRIW